MLDETSIRSCIDAARDLAKLHKEKDPRYYKNGFLGLIGVRTYPSADEAKDLSSLWSGYGALYWLSDIEKAGLLARWYVVTKEDPAMTRETILALVQPIRAQQAKAHQEAAAKGWSYCLTDPFLQVIAQLAQDSYSEKSVTNDVRPSGLQFDGSLHRKPHPEQPESSVALGNASGYAGLSATYYKMPPTKTELRSQAGRSGPIAQQVRGPVPYQDLVSKIVRDAIAIEMFDGNAFTDHPINNLEATMATLWMITRTFYGLKDDHSFNMATKFAVHSVLETVSAEYSEQEFSRMVVPTYKRRMGQYDEMFILGPAEAAQAPLMRVCKQIVENVCGEEEAHIAQIMSVMLVGWQTISMLGKEILTLENAGRVDWTSSNP